MFVLGVFLQSKTTVLFPHILELKKLKNNKDFSFSPVGIQKEWSEFYITSFKKNFI